MFCEFRPRSLCWCQVVSFLLLTTCQARLVLCTWPAVCIENGNDAHGQPWTNSNIYIYTAEYDCSIFYHLKSKMFSSSYICRLSCETIIGTLVCTKNLSNLECSCKLLTIRFLKRAFISFLTWHQWTQIPTVVRMPENHMTSRDSTKRLHLQNGMHKRPPTTSWWTVDTRGAYVGWLTVGLCHSCCQCFSACTFIHDHSFSKSSLAKLTMNGLNISVMNISNLISNISNLSQ